MELMKQVCIVTSYARSRSVADLVHVYAYQATMPTYAFLLFARVQRAYGHNESQCSIIG